MKEKNSLDVLLQELITLNYIEASYVENRINEQEEIYLHLVVSTLNKNNFMNEIFSIIDSLPKVVYQKKFKSSSYIKFEDNSACFVLFDFDNFEVNTHSMILYDPYKKIVSRKKDVLTDEVGYIMNEITYNLDRFCNFYKLDDKLMALRYLNIVNEKVLAFFKAMYEPQRVYRSYKELLNSIPSDLKNNYMKVVSKLSINSLIECAKMFIVLMDDFINNMSINIAFVVDIDYYMFVKRNIFN